MVGAIAAHAAARPEATALIWRDEEVGYGELVLRASRARAALVALGLEPCAPVAVRAEKTPDTIALVLGAMSAGHPVLLMSTTLPRATETHLLDNARCHVTMSAAPSPSAGHVVDLSTSDGLVPWPLTDHDGGPDAVLFLLTSSGSTGVPKIVPLTAGGVGRFVGWARAAFFGSGPKTALNYAPLNFDLCLLDIWTTLAAGGKVVLVDAARATRAGYLHELLDRHRVHLVQAVPMCFQLLLESTAGPHRAVRHVISTGDVLPPRNAHRLRGLFPGARLYNLYGCTETNDSFLHHIDGARQDAPIPLGRPIDGVSALLVDANGAVVEGEGVGELLVNTPFQAPGYLDAALTERAFVPHPEGADRLRYFASGDLVRRDASGELTLVGRNDFQVKVRGSRVNTQEVERALLAHPDVPEAVVFGEPDALAGTVLHAVVRRRATGSPDSLALRRHCAAQLPAAAVPAVLHLVDAALPRTSTGKPDRKQIASTYSKGH
ncbi:AMP-binding protein [Amycolatopsis sp. CA-230715]|uniref:AMP-binding protein n=1 Tax=Amycolatopsis sp. CA-230715 TaxID=2745196 RepID=UPI001C02CDDA|nr:AMP-binding protein [Amycolatopsis sp. CA-230715]